ncbi:hypothetical protein [Legionella waltersii]|uniref:Transmembrane protein n=1 Tax=Legionella waltersii TaxID=66969 RepID=A0A0W1AAJ7_9GAMM|nr:hypothetical protein [Legionella waltersii]KTD78345.1 hypothetical protein Lwal_1780 [Legionella waltersii]SNV06549.1 Uncharacterised protein [Legionella waltersii]
MAKDSNEQKKSPTWVKHLLTSLSGIGITSAIVWFATGMPIAPILVESFPVGVYVGVFFTFAAISVLNLTPFAMAAIYFSVVGALVGAGVVGLTLLASKFMNSKNVNEDSSDFELEDESEELSSESDEESSENNENTKSFWSRYYGLGVNFMVSSLASAGVSLLIPNVLVSFAVIPTFLAGVLTGLLAFPFAASVELLGVLALPFAAAGFSLSALVTGATAYLCLRNDNDATSPQGDINEELHFEHEDDFGLTKSSPLSQLSRKRDQNVEAHSEHDLSKEGSSKPLFERQNRDERRSSPKNLQDDAESCCGLSWSS